jgi:hypothetical protein
VGRDMGRRRAGEGLAPAQPLVRPAPRSAMFFPLVVLVAVLPGLYALRCWDLNPPGPWWGLRGLVVREGRWLDQVPAAASMGPEAEGRAYRAVALQPPLYAWLEAVGLALSPTGRRWRRSCRATRPGRWSSCWSTCWAGPGGGRAARWWPRC